jgi:hypothetical protein
MIRILICFFLISVSFGTFVEGETVSESYEKVYCNFIPVFILDEKIYEVDKNEDGRWKEIYKRNDDGSKIKVAELKEYFVFDNSYYEYKVYKNKNVIYVYSELHGDVGDYWTITAIDEITGENFEYTPGYVDDGEGGPMAPLAYIDNGHAYFAKALKIEAKVGAYSNHIAKKIVIETINVEPYGIGNNMSKNITVEIGKKKGMRYERINYEVGTPIEYDAIKVKEYNKDKIIFFDGDKTDNFRFEDKKIGKMYTKREVDMYGDYYVLKVLMNEIKNSEEVINSIEFYHEFYPSPPITSIEEEQIYSGLDLDNLKILTIEEFWRDLKRRVKEGKGYWVEKKGNKESSGSSLIDGYLKYWNKKKPIGH